MHFLHLEKKYLTFGETKNAFFQNGKSTKKKKKANGFSTSEEYHWLRTDQ